MAIKDKKAYIKTWQKNNRYRMRMHKLKWYYKNRTVINLMFSKAKGLQMDAADEWYLLKNPEG